MFYARSFCTKFWCQKLQRCNITRESCVICFCTKKGASKMLMKLTFNLYQMNFLTKCPSPAGIKLQKGIIGHICQIHFLAIYQISLKLLVRPKILTSAIFKKNSLYCLVVLLICHYYSVSIINSLVK